MNDIETLLQGAEPRPMSVDPNAVLQQGRRRRRRTWGTRSVALLGATAMAVSTMNLVMGERSPTSQAPAGAPSGIAERGSLFALPDGSARTSFTVAGRESTLFRVATGPRIEMVTSNGQLTLTLPSTGSMLGLGETTNVRDDAGIDHTIAVAVMQPTVTSASVTTADGDKPTVTTGVLSADGRWYAVFVYPKIIDPSRINRIDWVTPDGSGHALR